MYFTSPSRCSSHPSPTGSIRVPPPPRQARVSFDIFSWTPLRARVCVCVVYIYKYTDGQFVTSLASWSDYIVRGRPLPSRGNTVQGISQLYLFLHAGGSLQFSGWIRNRMRGITATATITVNTRFPVYTDNGSWTRFSGFSE